MSEESKGSTTKKILEPFAFSEGVVFETLPSVVMESKQKFSDLGSTPLVLESLHTHMDVVAGFVKISSTMVFFNCTDKVLEGELVFPLPKGTSIHGYALDVGGIMVDAVPVKKEQARQIFEQTVREKGPAVSISEIVEEKTNSFRTRVYPMNPNGRRIVKVTVLSQPVDAGENKVFFWNVLKPESLKEFKFTIDAPSSTICNVKRASSGVLEKVEPSSLDEKSDLDAICLTIPKEEQDKDVVVTEKDPDSGYTYFSSTISNLNKSQERNIEMKAGKVSIFYDVSSSKRSSNQKDELKLIRTFLELNNKIETIEMIPFSIEIHDRKTFRRSEVGDLEEYILSQHIDGGTCLPLSEISQKSTDESIDMVLVLSDGISNYGSKDLESELKEMKFRVPIYFVSTSKTSAYVLLEYIGRRSGGRFFDLSSGKEDELLAIAKRLGEIQFGLSDLRFNPNHLSEVCASEIINDSITIYGRILTNEETNLELHFTLGGQEFGMGKREAKICVRESRVLEGNSTMIRTLWAQEKINSLSIFSEKHSQEIFDLGIEYGIVTKNTSLIVLSELSQYQQHKIVPPKSLKEIRKKYLNQIDSEEQCERQREQQKIDNVVRLWNNRIEWHKRDFDPPEPSTPPTTSTKTTTTTTNEVIRQVQQQQTRELTEREKNVLEAKTLEHLQKYEEMYEVMKKVVEDNNDVTVEERNLLSVAMKNIIGNQRHNYKSIEDQIKKDIQSEEERQIVQNQLKEMRDVMDSRCDDMIQVCESVVAREGVGDEQNCFFYKLIGDYYRYKCETRKHEYDTHFKKKKKKTSKEEEEEGEEEEDNNNLTDEERKIKREYELVLEKTKEAYKKAGQHASNLPTTHCLRLGLKLNLSVFCFEVLDDPELASKIAKGSFEEAIEDLDTLTEEEYKDSTLIMQLLKDNLTLWNKDEDDDDKDDDDNDEEEEEEEEEKEKEKEKKEDKKKKNEASITIKRSIIGSPYLVLIEKASTSTSEEESKKNSAYVEYLKLKESTYQDSPSFYLDVSDYFITHFSDPMLGIRILTNILELELNNPQLQRIVAYRLDQAEKYEHSKQIFEQVKRNRPDEPQSYRDLALVIEKMGEFEEAARLLYHVIKMPVDSRFSEIELTCLMELNHILFFRIPEEDERREMIKKVEIDPRFVYRMDCDIRISMAWDTDMTDIDLHVTDPYQEHCYYGHRETKAGGFISRDFTQGYGPEEFFCKRVKHSGKFKVNAAFFANHQQSLTGGTAVLLSFYTHYMMENEKYECVVCRLGSGKETTKDICEIDFKVV